MASLARPVSNMCGFRLAGDEVKFADFSKFVGLAGFAVAGGVFTVFAKEVEEEVEFEEEEEERPRTEARVRLFIF